MDAKSIGMNIAKLRAQNGMTQAQLAKKLDISDKAVSKWETGQGYPDITLFPKLAALFGVTIDHLMSGDKKGITIAGNIIADIVKTITDYPPLGMLANITEMSTSVGGCVPNTAINLAKIDRTIPLSVVGKVGDDEYGKYCISQLQKYGINTDMVSVTKQKDTSFTDVMSLPSGDRTFFQCRGANADFGPEDIDISALNCSILHIGYILLLDKFDEYDAEYGTVMARFLHDVQKAGIKTSIDVVSDSKADYAAKIIPPLKYCDYVIINELEACNIFGIEPYDENGNIIKENIKTAMLKIAECGVKEKIVIHSKAISFALTVETGEITEVPSLKVPKEMIKGSVGAGDSFCSASLYSIYYGLSDKELLEFASGAAACNLFAANSVDGMRKSSEIYELCEELGRLEV